MTKYVITRTADCTEWGMVELEGDVACDIYRAGDGTSMRAVLVFEAPSWERAKEIFDWALTNLRKGLRKLHQDRQIPKSWDEVQSLLEPIQGRALEN